MASVQVPPAVQVQHPGSAIPAGMTQQQAQEVYMRFQQMKKQGVPTTDPEFIKTQAILAALQRQSELRKLQMQHQQQQMQQQQQQMQQQQQQQMQQQQQQQMQQQQQQQMQQQQQQQRAQQQAMQNGANGVVNVNGAGPARPPQAAGPQTTMAPSTTALGASALPATANAAPNANVAAGAPAQNQASQFSQAQLNLLWTQIKAFRLLGKNAGVPIQLQKAIFEHRQRRRTSLTKQDDPALPAAAAPGAAAQDGAKPGPNGADAQAEAALVPQPKSFKSVKSPYDGGLVRKTISYMDHGRRKSRLIIPGIFPTGIDFEQLRSDREKIVFNRMSARYAELKSLPGNLAHWDASQDEVVADDTAKRKAIIEMKKLALYSKQRALRDRVGKQMMHYDNLAMTTNRAMYRRMKKQNVREARITEKLEKQQRDARENRERKKHGDFLQAVYNHRNQVLNAGQAQRVKTQKLSRLMYGHHFNIEKEEQKRIERTAKQRLQALKANDEEAYLKLLDQAKDTRITHLLRQTDGFLHQLASSVRAQQRQAAERYGDDGELPEESEADEEDEESSRKIDYYAVAHRTKEEVTAQATILVGGTLKEYQIKGLQWMLSLYNNNLNGILADEMGLGKTIQTISLITYLIEKKHQNGPYLVIVPLSTLTNWNLEFDKWAPSVAKVVYKGPPNTRKLQQEKIRQGRFQVLLTTYEYIIKDRPLLSKIKWFHMIIDEGHRMKNSNSKLSATIQQYYSTRFRLILTGTPLQNNLAELWAMLNFVLPNIFKSAKTFDEWFNTPFANTGGQDKMELTEEEQILVIRRLHKVLRPFLLRRLKKDVEKDLPDKTEKVIKCKFSALQSRLYKQMVTHQKIAVSDGKGGKTGARGLSNMIMQLRKLCNHPFVFDEVENQMNPANISNDMLWRTAGKFELLDRILPKYKATGHRVLMFFQMTAIMDIMEDFLRFRGIQYLRLDGTTKSEDRSDLLRDFNAPDSPYFMFLLSTRAGGLGLNLQTADTVIIYDSDWNPHQDLQAQDRAHRIGQKNEVRILRLISSASVEEKILERARFKLDMDGKVIQAGRFDNKSSETDRDAMLRTLLETADMAEAGEQEEMDDEELNMILARSDDELIVFQKLDDERVRDPTYGTAPGCKGVPRLMAEDELPEIYLNEGNPVEEEVETILGRGARERTKVKYDDGLTEEQWLMAVDDDDDSPEAAAARKAARKERREANKVRKATHLNASMDNSPVASRASTEEVEATPVKKRGRKPGSKNQEKRKAEEGEDEPPAKKRRGPQGRPKAVSNAAAINGAEGRLAPDVRDRLQKSLKRIFDGLMNFEVDDDEPEEKPEGEKDDEDGPPKRLIIGPFVKLPPKRDWGDYYLIIAAPICMNDIQKKMKKEEYHSLGDMRKDLDLMVKNCRTFNEESSGICQDVNLLEAFYRSQFEKEFAANADLRALEDPSSAPSSTAPPSAKAGSAAPSAATDGATPQPTPSGPPTRIKLVSSGSAAAAAAAKEKEREKEKEGNGVGKEKEGKEVNGVGAGSDEE
ncbi:chromatin structure-remodeling complex subunit snf21 [Staphylotrichum tortipilum]|uniref:Chromatin structure-remodeling complex subunit snf21 n=1 Tax=Staphylotrichum tortipilum TaxID=2831512 RepID=A0AAN6MNV8_9PEZI|nr:chromatin structure-remodeling complex subunit snf21 [Staphylotrichum longicolle]